MSKFSLHTRHIEIPLREIEDSTKSMEKCLHLMAAVYSVYRSKTLPTAAIKLMTDFLSPQGNPQKTNGLSRKAEKNTSLSLAERKGGIFRAVKIWKACFVFGIRSWRSRWAKTKGRKWMSRCFSGEKTKLSVNWILLSKSSQQHFALNWISCGCA